MSKFLRGATLAGLSMLAVTSAQAQSDVDWTGPYVGLSGGGSWAHADGTSFSTTTGAAVNHVDGKTGGGSTLGLIGGYDQMLPMNLVLGVAIDGYRTDISGSTTNASSKTDFAGTGRVRLGYAIGDLLPYATGGLAWQHNKTSVSVGGVQARDSGTSLGWTVGGGVDYALGHAIGWGGLTIGAEYRYSQFGDEHLNFPAAGISTRLQHVRSHTVLFDVTYHFTAPPSAPPAPPAPARVVAAPPAPPPAAIAPQQQLFIVFFEFDKSALTPDGKKVVDSAASAFKAGKSGIAIAGYTDLSGTQQYNLALSKRRAETVKSALVKDGVPAAAINESWHGKDNPRVPTADGVREPQNRRVEISM